MQTGCSDEGRKQFGGEKRKLTSCHVAPFGRSFLRGASFYANGFAMELGVVWYKSDPFLQRGMNKESDRAKNNAHEMII